jgi:hypothetical protein
MGKLLWVVPLKIPKMPGGCHQLACPLGRFGGEDREGLMAFLRRYMK